VDCELHFDDVTFQRSRRGERIRISKGSFGAVYAATFGDQLCVVKVPRLDRSSRTVPPELQAAFWAEVCTQFAFRYPHIVALHGGYADVDSAVGGVVEVGAVMERCSGGMLEGRLHGGQGMWAARAEDRPTAAAAGEELARLAAGVVRDA
jgi:hypothetical protein